MKNPVLIMGILMFTVFLMDVRRKNSILLSRDKLNPTSCRSLMVRLEKRLPANFNAQCLNNDLEVSIKSAIDHPNLDTLRQALYMELANNIVLLTKNSPPDNLEMVGKVTIMVDSPKFKIEAYTLGKHMVKFGTIREKQFILEHLKATVQVKELNK